MSITGPATSSNAKRKHQSGPEWPGGINPAVTVDELEAEAKAAAEYAEYMREMVELREREARAKQD